MNETSTQVVSTMMSMSDPRLPLVASRAAIAFDNASRGEEADFTPVKSLAGFLRSAFMQDKGAESSGKRNLDVGTVGLVGRALNESAWDGGAQTVSDVVDKAWRIAESMARMPAADGEMTLPQMRAFCVALGNCLIAHRELFHDARPTSRYKR